MPTSFEALHDETRHLALLVEPARPAAAKPDCLARRARRAVTRLAPIGGWVAAVLLLARAA